MVHWKIYFATFVLLFTIGVPSFANACGWYAISVCSRYYQGAQRATHRYGGQVVNTDNFENFVGGYYCAVVDPKTKDAAEETAWRMKLRGAYDAYIKYSC